MTATEGIVLFVLGVILVLARPVDGESAPFLKVWFVGQICAVVAMVA